MSFIPPVDEIERRVTAVSNCIVDAANRSGRDPKDIKLLAVTKTFSVETLRDAVSLGLREFGENYVQEAVSKINQLGDIDSIEWHFIGHLQTNKVGSIAGKFDLIHSVDSFKLAQHISNVCRKLNIRQNILVQIKLGVEQSKSGVSVDQALLMAEKIGELDGIDLRGFMAIAPLKPNDQVDYDPRPYFATARRLFDQLPDSQRTILSMGMSSDFEDAIAEGSTLVRIGSRLFGNRTQLANNPQHYG